MNYYQAFFYAIMLILLGGCVAPVKPISERGNLITYSHGIGRSTVEAVYKDASDRCANKEMIAKKTSSTCPFHCVTDFECVAHE